MAGQEENALRRAARLERELAAAVDEARSAVEASADGARIPGVAPIGRHMFAVRAGRLDGSWLPEYYDAERQKQLVREKLSKASTLSGLRSALKSLLDGPKYVLHPSVRTILEQALADVESTH